MILLSWRLIISYLCTVFPFRVVSRKWNQVLSPVSVMILSLFWDVPSVRAYVCHNTNRQPEKRIVSSQLHYHLKSWNIQSLTTSSKVYLMNPPICQCHKLVVPKMCCNKHKICHRGMLFFYCRHTLPVTTTLWNRSISFDRSTTKT